jgi:serine/threonine protein kinase
VGPRIHPEVGHSSAKRNAQAIITCARGTHLWHETWPLRYPVPPGCRRHGRGVSCPGFPVEPLGCDQGSDRVVLADRDRLQRFAQEARSAAALNHPNILSIFDIGEQQGAPYVVSELLEGETLRERLRNGPPPIRRVVDYSLQVARGLAAAHDKGIVHRDRASRSVTLLPSGRLTPSTSAHSSMIRLDANTIN